MTHFRSKKYKALKLALIGYILQVVGLLAIVITTILKISTQMPMITQSIIYCCGIAVTFVGVLVAEIGIIKADKLSK